MRFEFKVDLHLIRYKAKHKKLLAAMNKKMPNLRKQLVMAHQIKDFIEKNNLKCSEDMANYIPLTRSRVSQIFRLLNMAPEIQEEILLCNDKTISRIGERTIRKIPREINWEKQKKMWKEITS